MPSKKKAVEAAAPPQENASMAEVPSQDLQAEEDGNLALFADQEQRIRILHGSTETAASFELQKEDHTLGNALRYIIMKNPDVEFCGYSIPHPSEAVMNIRIQTYKGTALEALEKGLNDLMDLCDVVADKFTQARVEFSDQMDSDS